MKYQPIQLIARRLVVVADIQRKRSLFSTDNRNVCQLQTDLKNISEIQRWELHVFVTIPLFFCFLIYCTINDWTLNIQTLFQTWSRTITQESMAYKEHSKNIFALQPWILHPRWWWDNLNHNLSYVRNSSDPWWKCDNVLFQRGKENVS